MKLIVILLFALNVSASNFVRLTAATFDSHNFESSNLLMESEGQKLWIVTFNQPITEKNKQELVLNDFEVLDFIPDQSLLVRGDRKNQELKATDQWIPYQPAWKWSPYMRKPSITTDTEPRLVIIRSFKSSETQKLIGKVEQLQRTLVLHQSSPFVVVRSYDSDLFKISEFFEVAFLQDLPQFETLAIDLGQSERQVPNPSRTGFETGTKVMNMDQLWDAGYKGSGQIVAMGDTGLDRGDLNQIHPDFSKAIIKGKNFAPYGKSWEDPMGHGTHVAGSIVSRGVQSDQAFKGAAFEADLIAHSLWSQMLNNMMVPTKLGELFAAAQKDGAKFHTNSWGSAKNFGAYDAFARQVDEYSFNHPDFLILFSAGNSGVDRSGDGRIDADSIGSPGTAKNALTVGASENYELSGGIQRKISELRNAKEIWGVDPIFSSKVSDNPKGIAMFSSRGPTDDGRIKPDLVAPGTNILSTRSFHSKSTDLWGRYDDYYVWSGGTSMSTPLVAGAAAVTREVLQKRFNIQNPSATLIKGILMATSEDLFPGQYGFGGAAQEQLSRRPNFDQGYGLVNASKVLELNPEWLIENRKGLATGELKEIEIELQTEQKLNILVVWNDAPANENVAKTLVNDLALEVTGPETEFVSDDSINNWRHFEKTSKPGIYKIRVVGRQIPMGINGKQPYSLIIN